MADVIQTTAAAVSGTVTIGPDATSWATHVIAIAPPAAAANDDEGPGYFPQSIDPCLDREPFNCGPSWVTDPDCGLANSGPTAVAAVNTQALLDTATTYLLRFRIENLTGAAGETSFRFEVNHAGGGYVTLTTSSSNVRIVNADTFDDGLHVQEVIGGSGMYIDANAAADENGVITLPAQIGVGEAFEGVLAVEIVDADVSDLQTGLIRVVKDDSSVLETYSNIAAYQVNKPGAVVVEQPFPMNDNPMLPPLSVIGY